MQVPSLSQTEFLILAALSPRDLYGSEITARVKRITDEKVRLSIGGLYTTLHRMEDKGLVSSRWGETTEVREGARRRYYRVTGLGARAFKETGRLQRSALKWARQFALAGAQ